MLQTLGNCVKEFHGKIITYSYIKDCVVEEKQFSFYPSLLRTQS